MNEVRGKGKCINCGKDIPLPSSGGGYCDACCATKNNSQTSEVVLTNLLMLLSSMEKELEIFSKEFANKSTELTDITSLQFFAIWDGIERILSWQEELRELIEEMKKSLPKGESHEG